VTNRFCIVIPHYNHDRQLTTLLPEILAYGLPLIVIDDGSDRSSHEAVSRLVSTVSDATFEAISPNQGKGAAVIRGVRIAKGQGFTHAIQIDADGQHCIADIARLIAESEIHPDSIVSGLPRFGEDVPKSRLHGRKITLFWSRIETLSSEILDAMCGFRVYPIEPFLSVCEGGTIRLRMQFDTEILVRSSWRGQSIRFVPTEVCYPDDGISHFRLLRDNVHITLMHIRLFFGMLIRLPRLLYRIAAVRLV